MDKQLGVLKMSQVQSERRTVEAERRLDELIQGQTITEQEARKSVEAQQDLDHLKQQLTAAKSENLVNIPPLSLFFCFKLYVYILFLFLPVNV